MSKVVTAVRPPARALSPLGAEGLVLKISVVILEVAPAALSAGLLLFFTPFPVPAAPCKAKQKQKTQQRLQPGSNRVCQADRAV
jgi:hypothetical protein